MGLFDSKEKQKIILPANAKCSRCGRKIRPGTDFAYIEKKLYCGKCAKAKKEWDFLLLMSLLDD